MPKIRAFRSWVVKSSAKARAFAGWVAGVETEVLPPRRKVRIYTTPTITGRFACVLAAPICEMRATAIDHNYLAAVAEIDADVAEVLLMEAL